MRAAPPPRADGSAGTGEQRALSSMSALGSGLVGSSAKASWSTVVCAAQ
jgi:hypothetical protein